MKLIKRLNHTTDKDGVTTSLDILIYEKNIVWYLSETMKFEDGDEFTEDQSYNDYLKNGPPQFAENISPETRAEIDLILEGGKFH